jgi:hypothetical protein
MFSIINITVLDVNPKETDAVFKTASVWLTPPSLLNTSIGY